MSSVYGKDLKFIVFDICIGSLWLSVPDMDQVATLLGLDIVSWIQIPTDLVEIDAIRDAPSVQAARNGCGDGKPREGVVLRQLIEVTRNDGRRIIAKHKLDTFSERATPQKVIDPAKLQVLAAADAIAQEWVTEMRLTHVIDKLGATDISQTGSVINAMVEDVVREAAGEIVDSKDARRAIGARAASMFKARVTKVPT